MMILRTLIKTEAPCFQIFVNVRVSSQGTSNLIRQDRVGRKSSPQSSRHDEVKWLAQVHSTVCWLNWKKNPNLLPTSLASAPLVQAAKSCQMLGIGTGLIILWINPLMALQSLFTLQKMNFPSTTDYFYLCFKWASISYVVFLIAVPSCSWLYVAEWREGKEEPNVLD